MYLPYLLSNSTKTYISNSNLDKINKKSCLNNLLLFYPPLINCYKEDINNNKEDNNYNKEDNNSSSKDMAPNDLYSLMIDPIKDKKISFKKT